MRRKLFLSALILMLAIAITILLFMWPLSFSSVKAVCGTQGGIHAS